MKTKFILYVIMWIISIWSMESININHIFKKNRIFQARVFYFLLTVSLAYLSANFLYDLYLSIL